MLACGGVWQPTSVRRVIETLPTSTRCAKVATNLGNAFLKGIGNPAGLDSLATELVGAELASWFGLKIPPFAIVNVRDIEIPMDGIGFVQEGPAFVSREILGTTSDGGNVLLSKLNNPDDVAKLVTFDTWIRNNDRYPANPEQQQYQPNFDNLFFSPVGRKFDLIIFDHSHCFVETTLDPELHQQNVLSDDRVYGYFPEFKPYITPERVMAARRRLRQMNQQTAQEIVGSIPSEWSVSAQTRARWAEVICNRAESVARFIEFRLLGQGGLELVE